PRPTRRREAALDRQTADQGAGDTAVNTRNYLAHSFLRDRAPFLDLPGVAEDAAEELVKVSAKLDEFEERLAVYMRDDLGVVDLSEEELKQLGLDVALDPAEW